ncbi:MAG: BrnT family toxin [Bdellovibrionota bacterium]
MDKKNREIDFIEAREVFNDTNVTIGPGMSKDDEERWLRVGMAKGKLWTVGYTLRRGLIRIFMVRPAHDDEKEAYYG